MSRIKVFLSLTFLLSLHTAHGSNEPVIVEHPKNISECIGGSATLQVVVAENVLVTYQWQISMDKLTWLDIDKANTSIYKPEATQKGAIWYRVVITNEDKSVSIMSDIAEVNVADRLSVLVHAVNNGTICLDEKLVLKATTSGGAGNCTLQWQEQEVGQDWHDIEGETKDEFLVKSKAISHKRYKVRFQCSGSGCCD